MGSVEDIAYAAAYFGLSAVLLVALGLTIVVAAARRPFGGQGLIAIGLVVTLLSGVGFDLVKSTLGDLVYQRAHFTLFYAAFGLVAWGIDRASAVAHRPAWRPIAWAAFAGTTLLALGVLWLAPSLYHATGGDPTRYIQLPLFYVPLVVVLLSGGWAFTGAAAAGRAGAWRAEAFVIASLVGVLREGGVLPATGEPLLDVLTIFGPLTLGGVALCLSQRAVPRTSASS